MSFLPLTDIEKGFLAYDRASASNSVLTFTLDIKVLKRDIDLALETEGQRHPYLSLYLEEGMDSPLWRTRRFSPDIREIPLEDLWEETCRSLEEPFDLSHDSMVRLKWSHCGEKRTSFILIIPHLVCDLPNTIGFLNGFLKNLEMIHAGVKLPSSEPLLLIRPDLLLFPREKSIPPRISQGNHSLEGWEIRTDPSEIPVTHSHPVVSTGRTEFVMLSYTEEVTRKYLNTLTARKIAVNSAVFEAAFSTTVPEDSWVKVNTAVDLRRFIPGKPVKGGDMGLWAGKVTHYIRSDRKHWETMGQRYQSAVAETLRHSPFYFTRLLGDPQAEKLAAAPTLPQIKLSSHGDLNQVGLSADYSGFRIEQLWMLTSFHRDLKEPNYSVCVPSILNGRLRILFPYGSGTKSAAKTMEDAVKTTTSMGLPVTEDRVPAI